MNISCATLAITLKSMTAATSIMVTGVCPAYIQILRAPSGSTINFVQAPITRLDLTGLSNMTIAGLVSNNSPYAGLNINSSTNMLISAPHFNKPGTAGITINGSKFIEVSYPVVEQSSGDGIDIVGSTNVNIHDGLCENNIRTATHPDCVQMWSLPGQQLQHIIVQRMKAIGRTQGFDNFGDTNGSSDIQILNNTATVTEANCISFNAVTKLVIQGNKCFTMPGGTVGPAVVRVFNSPNASVTNNTSI